ncbi:MAG: hypothetical protein PVG83_13650 [Acidimicrobiia bacterium]
MRVGLLVTGDTSVRAAHSLAAHEKIDEVVVIGPATSKTFEVVETAKGCDLLVGSGEKAPRMAARHGLPLVWDGCTPEDGVVVWCASPLGLTFALASRETDPRLVAMAHPEFDGRRTERSTRFPDPVGRVSVRDTHVHGRPIAIGRSPNEFAACLVEGAARRVSVVDDGSFLSGVTLAAGVSVAVHGHGPVWDTALDYLEAATEMGLVMAESG